MSHISSTLTLEAAEPPLILPSQTTTQPTSDTKAFLNELPHIEPDAVQSLGQAIAENRARRRADTHE